MLLVPHVLGALIAGIVVLDLGCQGIHITNQSEIYALAGEARSRVNSAYMTCYFIGGTLGSIGSAVCYSSFGWTGVARAWYRRGSARPHVVVLGRALPPAAGLPRPGRGSGCCRRLIPDEAAG